MKKEFTQEQIVVFLLILFSVASSLIVLMFGVALIPLIIFCFFILYVFINFNNSIALTIGIMSMMNLCVVHIGIVDLRISQLLWAPILIMALLRGILRPSVNKDKLQPSIGNALLILIISSFLSILQSSYPFVSLREGIQFIYLATIFFFVVSVVNNESILKRIITSLLYFSSVFIVFGFLKFLLGYSIIPFIEVDGFRSISFFQTPLKEQYAFTGSTLFKRADAFFLGPVATAAYLIPMVILSASLLLDKETLSQRIKSLCYFCLIFGSLLILLTFSRAGIVILPVLLLSLYSLKKRTPKRLLIFLFCLIAILFVSGPLKDRLLETINLQESSTQAHLRYWKQAIAMFFKRPLFGFGAGTFQLQEHLIDVPLYFKNKPVGGATHNIFLLMASETGLVGLSSLVLFFYLFLKKIRASIDKLQTGYIYNVNLGLFIGVIGIIFMNSTMNFFKIEIFWILMALSYAVSNIAKNKYEK